MERGTPEVGIVPIDLIDIGARHRKAYNNIPELAADIAINGMISSVALIRTGDRYLLAAGGRRMQAAKVAGLTSVPARIYNGDEDEHDLRTIELSENIHREDLTWQEELTLKEEVHRLQVEKIGGRKSIKGAPGWTQADTANLLGQSPANISMDLELKRAMNQIPQLGQAKTKDEARKMLSKLIKNVDQTNKAAEVKLRLSTQPTAVRKLNLVNSYIVGDFFTWAKGQKSEMANVVEIDPPYAIDLDIVKKSTQQEGSVLRTTDEYNEISPEEYPQFMMKTLVEAYRLLKEGGWLILWFAPDPWFQFMFDTATSVGFVGNRIHAIWTKGQGQTNAPNYYMGSSWEPFFYFRKGVAEIVKKGRSNVFDYRPIPPMMKTHPTERPIGMMADILSVFANPGDMIVVPFAGSGNTILAASNINCTAVGCDLTQKYKDSFVIKVDSGEPGLYTSYGG